LRNSAEKEDSTECYLWADVDETGLIHNDAESGVQYKLSGTSQTITSWYAFLRSYWHRSAKWC